MHSIPAWYMVVERAVPTSKQGVLVLKKRANVGKLD